MPTTSDIIGQRLYDAGCRHAFGIPGGEVLALMDGLAKAGIEFHLVKHENSCGFMAEGTYHANGAPAILVATVGPGVVNAINVVANAWQDQVPMIFLTGCYDAAETLVYNHQVFDHVALMKAVTKASYTVADGNVDVLVDKAMAVALDGQPGPVHIDLPIGIAKKEYDVATPMRRPAPSPAAPAPGADLENARQWLREAKRCDSNVQWRRPRVWEIFDEDVEVILRRRTDAACRRSDCRRIGEIELNLVKSAALVEEVVRDVPSK